MRTTKIFSLSNSGVMNKADFLNIAEQMGAFSPSNIPIGGSRKHLLSQIGDLNDSGNLGGENATDGRAMISPVGRISLRNAFRISHNKFKLLYVSLAYSNYRYAAKKVYGWIPPGFDIDHLLGRKLAMRSGFQYVLVGRVSSGVNRAHGFNERPGGKGILALIPTCHADERIALKATGQPPGVGHLRYVPANTAVNIGSEVEKGAWGFTLGIDPQR